MAESSESWRQLHDTASHELAAIAERFESAWQQGPPPDIAAFLPPPGPLRQAVCWELVRIDLERRYKTGEAVRVETYLDRFPELAGDQGAALSLIAVERDFRRRADPQTGVDDYAARFPQFRAAFPWLKGAPTVASPAAQPRPRPSLPGYEILGDLGAGGMGMVYLARHLRLDRLVAIKVMLSPEGAGFVERFQREARALAALNHPHIVAVHDFGETEGGCYLVLEFVDGKNLRHRLHAGRADPAAIVPWMLQMADALQFAHEAGIVHRDIKPENILLDARSRVKIADFGLAKLLRPSGDSAGPVLTNTSQVMGTMHYMAPEQWWQPKTVDHRADIYSLGVVFYELLTGELPLGRFEPPSRKSGVDPRFDPIVLRMLENEPAKRFQKISDVQAALAAFTPAAVTAVLPPPAGVTTGLTARFWLQTVGLGALAWLMSAGLWDFGLLGLTVAGVLMAALLRFQVGRALALLPALHAAWRQRDLRHRYVNGSLAVGLFGAGFAAVVASHFFLIERPYLDPSKYVEMKKGVEHELLTGLKVSTKEPLQLVSKELAPASEAARLTWLFALAGCLLIPAAVFIFLETVPYRDSWTHHWQPALVLGSGLLLGVPIAQLLTGMAALPGISERATPRAADDSTRLQQPFDHPELVAGNLEAVTTLLEQWAEQNDYVLDYRGDWTLLTAIDRKELAQVRVVEMKPRSPYDRWQLTMRGWRRARQGVYVRCVCAGIPPETMALFASPSLVRTDQADLATWSALAESLATTLQRRPPTK